MKKMIFSFCFLIVLFQVSGQVLDLEKTYDIPGKAGIGDIANISYDQNSGQSVISFIVKSRSDMVSIESYSFDKDFNFIKTENEELSFDKAKQKYPWWNYNGEHFEKEALIVDESDDIVLKKKKFEFDYNWRKMTYKVNTDVLNKIKLKNDAGSKYYHHRNWLPENENHVLILAGERSKSDKLLQNKTFHLLKINDADFSILKELEIKFEYPQEIISPRFIDEKTEGRGSILENDIILVFAPIDEGAKVSDPQKTNFTYIRIDKDLNIVDRIAFSSPNSFWSIEDYILNPKNNSIYLLGAALGENSKYYNDLTNTKKFDRFQIMKVIDHKIGYLSSVTIDEINQKVVMPPTQKKATKYEGKNFIIAEYTITDDGKLFLVGQTWYTDVLGTMNNINSGVGLPGKKQRKIKYSDCFGLGFDDTGKLIGQYLYDTKGFMGGNDFSVYQYLFRGKNPDNIYWLVLQPTYWNWNILTSVYDYRPIKQPPLQTIKVQGTKFNCDITSSDISKIDLSQNSISDFTNYQVNKEKKKFYYLSTSNPIIMTNDNKLVLFGSQAITKGKVLWFSRLRLD